MSWCKKLIIVLLVGIAFGVGMNLFMYGMEHYLFPLLDYFQEDYQKITVLTAFLSLPILIGLYFTLD